MLFLVQSEDPPNCMICGLKKEHMLKAIVTFIFFASQFLLKILPIICSFLLKKGSERFAEPHNGTLNLLNLHFDPNQ